MAMEYQGTLDGQRALLDHVGISGSWEARPDGVFMMRGADGPNLHWPSGSRTLWFEGRPAACRRLAIDVADALYALPISAFR